MRVLIIEDEESLRRMFCRCFSLRDWDSAAPGSTDEAIAAFASQSFDLVLCDVGLGDRDGIDVAQQLRSAKPDVPIVIMSAIRENLDRAKAAGFHSCLRKPFTMGELKAFLGPAT